MIIGYVGTPGSGKTYEAVKTIIANLKRGRRVYTNIDGLEIDSCRRFIQDGLDLDDYEFNKRLVFLSKDEVYHFWEIAKDGAMIVLDEVHKNFSNREWASEKNKQFADWASTHRHHGFDLILITQDIEKVEKHVRSLLEWTYFFRKVNFFGGAVSQKYMCYSYSGDDHSGQPLSKNVRTYNPVIFKCYNSFATTDAKEIGFMTHVNILKHPVFFILPLILLFAGYMFSKSSFASGDLFGTKARLASVSAKPLLPVVAASPVSTPAAVTVVPSVPALAPPAAVLPSPPPFVPAESLVSDSVVFPGSASNVLVSYIWQSSDGVFHITNLLDTIPPGVKYRVVRI